VSLSPFDMICVLIPTYNNAATLPAVLASVLEVTPHVLVVNDGSTDGTAATLAGFPEVQVLGYERNKGKGWALRAGFARAFTLGYSHALVMDADGQHYASDIPVFCAALEVHPGAIIVGARNMSQESVPGGSSFGRRFSNFWFRLETGIDCPDTQSGFRLYPLEPLRVMRFFTVRYEFEIEVLVRAAWRGVPVVSVPVRVYYPPASERISHFRPFWDFARISVLNAVLVILSLFIAKKRRV
jgi:glycosyltransferase involved in cell wall biosynthesis